MADVDAMTIEIPGRPGRPEGPRAGWRSPGRASQQLVKVSLAVFRGKGEFARIVPFTGAMSRGASGELHRRRSYEGLPVGSAGDGWAPPAASRLFRVDRFTTVVVSNPEARTRSASRPGRGRLESRAGALNEPHHRPRREGPDQPSEPHIDTAAAAPAGVKEKSPKTVGKAGRTRVASGGAFGLGQDRRDRPGALESGQPPPDAADQIGLTGRWAERPRVDEARDGSTSSRDFDNAISLQLTRAKRGARVDLRSGAGGDSRPALLLYPRSTSETAGVVRACHGSGLTA